MNTLAGRHLIKIINCSRLEETCQNRGLIAINILRVGGLINCKKMLIQIWISKHNHQKAYIKKDISVYLGWSRSSFKGLGLGSRSRVWDSAILLYRGSRIPLKSVWDGLGSRSRV